MKDAEARRPSHAVAYRCGSCARAFVAVDSESTHELICTCGAPLHVEALRRGMYELASPEPCDLRVTAPPRPSKAKASTDTPDLGYGESHGYAPAHGGPSGPGDAPADPSSSSDES